MSGALHWEGASVTWAPQLSKDAMTLRVPASIRGHAREVLMLTLPPSLEHLSGMRMGDQLRVEVQASEEVAYEDGSTGVEPGQIMITAEHLTDRFEATDLKQRLDALVAEAVNEGNVWAARDADRIERFLGEIAAAD